MDIQTAIVILKLWSILMICIGMGISLFVIWLWNSIKETIKQQKAYRDTLDDKNYRKYREYLDIKMWGKL